MIDTVHESDQFRIQVVFTDRSNGDFTPDTSDPGLRQRQRSLAPGEWSWLQQVHGGAVHVVGGEPICGLRGDALVTTTEASPLSVRTADCAPVLMWSSGPPTAVPAPVLGAVHAGWKGLAAGVVERCAEGMRAMGATDIDWMVGPCISPQEYEFGSDDLEGLVDRFGPQVRARTNWGAPALDLRAAVTSACAGAGLGESRWDDVGTWPPCTATEPSFYSHRARSDTGRQVAVIWWERARGERHE